MDSALGYLVREERLGDLFDGVDPAVVSQYLDELKEFFASRREGGVFARRGRGR